MSKRMRKQQTRLVFTPLPSSSPATKGYNQQIQSRAAAVDYHASPRPSKRRRVREIIPEDEDGLEATGLDGANDILPTPADTIPSQRQHRATEQSEEQSNTINVARTLRRKSNKEERGSRSRRATQQQLDFSGTRDPESFSSPIRLSSSALPQSSARSGVFSSQSRRVKSKRPVVDISSEESDASDLPSPGNLLRAKSSAEGSRGKSSKGKDSEQQSRVTRSSSRPTIESDSDENIVVHTEDKGVTEPASEDASEEEMPTTLGRQPRKRVRQASVDSFISSSPPPAVDSDDDDLEIIEDPRSRSRKGEEDDDEDEDEDDVPITPGRRTLKKPRQVSKQEQEDLDEDLDFLGPSSDVEDSGRTPRNTQTQAKNKRQSALELLKRKRASQTSSARQNATQDGNPVMVESNEDEYEEEEEEEQSEEEQQPVITSSRQMFRADDEDEAFIDENEADSALLGVPGGLPLQFTRYASMKAKELFKFAVEWMVQKKINPAFRMDDEIYDLTFKKLNDEVSGLAASKFVSAAWKPDFVIALKARPEIAFYQLDALSADLSRDKCEACNRTNHTPSYEVTFMGKPYHPETLEELGGGDDDDDDDDDDDSSDSSNEGEPTAQNRDDYDYQGRKIPPETRTYYLGRFCKQNAETGHDLSHWRHHLYDWVVTWLIKEGYNSSEKIVQRDRWSTKKRRKYANKIADRMEREGQVKELWQAFRKNIDEARNSKQGRFRGSSP